MAEDSSVSMSSWHTRRTDSRMRSRPWPDWNASSRSDRTDWSRAIGVISLVGSARNTPRITPLAPPIGGYPRSTQSPPLEGTQAPVLVDVDHPAWWITHTNDYRMPKLWSARRLRARPTPARIGQLSGQSGLVLLRGPNSRHCDK